MVSHWPLGLLGLSLAICLLVLALCVAAETAFLAFNRQRMGYLATRSQRHGNQAAWLVEQADRLVGVLRLLGTLLRVTAAALATWLGLQWGGETGVMVAVLVLTLVVLVLVDLVPKTVALLHPERVALVLVPLLAPVARLLRPLAHLVTYLARQLLRSLGLLSPPDHQSWGKRASTHPLRSIVNEITGLIPRAHQRMLIGLLDLENITVEDVMVPRADILGLNLAEDWSETLARLEDTRHTRLPVYREDIDKIAGILHVRDALSLLTRQDMGREALLGVLREPYFVPAGTPLHTQLLNFQRHHQTLGLVVNEYGDIQGLITLEDILAEVVGELTPEVNAPLQDVYLEPEGSYLVDGTTSVRELNRRMGWNLPSHGPKTLNGLIVEHMETLPEVGTSLLLAGYPVEVVQTSGNVVKTVRVKPRLTQRD